MPVVVQFEADSLGAQSTSFPNGQIVLGMKPSMCHPNDDTSGVVHGVFDIGPRHANSLTLPLDYLIASHVTYNGTDQPSILAYIPVNGGCRAVCSGYGSWTASKSENYTPESVNIVNEITQAPRDLCVVLYTGRVNESDPLQRVSPLGPFYIIKVKRDTSVLVKCDFVLNAYFIASPLKVGDKLPLDKLSIINDEHGKPWELRTTSSSGISQSFTVHYSRKSNGNIIFSKHKGLGRSSYYPCLQSGLREINAPSSPEQSSHASERFSDGDGAIPSSSGKPSQTADQSEEQRFSYADCDGYTSKVRKTLFNRIKNLICIGA